MHKNINRKVKQILQGYIPVIYSNIAQFKSCLYISHVGFIDTLLIEDLPSLYGGSGTTQVEDSTSLSSDGDQETVSFPASSIVGFALLEKNVKIMKN